MSLRDRFGVSERRACGLTSQHRSSQRYHRRLAPEEALLRQRLQLLARRHPRYGYREPLIGNLLAAFDGASVGAFDKSRLGALDDDTQRERGLDIHFLPQIYPPLLVIDGGSRAYPVVKRKTIGGLRREDYFPYDARFAAAALASPRARDRDEP